MPKPQLLADISGKVKGIFKGGGERNGHDKENIQRDEVTFVINGISYSVKSTDQKFGPESRLVDFIRDEAQLKGTKWTCREGGCGACVVTVRTKDVRTQEQVVRAVNSCLAPVWACDGWDISTVEDLGNGEDGYHPIQKKLVHMGGSQCGFCSPGMVMNMYALTSSKKDGLTAQDVEDNFDGNLCRCTGYRPIMDAFKSFALDADPQLKAALCCHDIEDLGSKSRNLSLTSNEPQNDVPTRQMQMVEQKCKKNPASIAKAAYTSCLCCASCNGGGSQSEADLLKLAPKNFPPLILQSPSGAKWIKAGDLKTAFDALKNFIKDKTPYRIVAGNTGTGVFKEDGPYDAYLEVNCIPELSVQSMGLNEAILGAGTSLTKSIEFFQNLSQKTGFQYTLQLANHIKRVANTPVRNSGTIAGNLMLKHAHPEFPSDIFLLLEVAGAKIFVASSPAPSDFRSYSPLEFLQRDMKGKLIVHLTLPSKTVQHVFRSYKITKRFQNAHAYVNAAFLFKIGEDGVDGNFKVLEKPTIAFGGIGPNFSRALKTEEALNGKELKNVDSLRNALIVLQSEIRPDHQLPDASPEYRKFLALSLLYKTILGILGPHGVSQNFQSGSQNLDRKLHTGKQFYDIDTEFKDSPLYKAVPKIEANYQVSGTAQYVNDIPKQTGELYGVFVRATVANAMLKSVDPSEALKMAGVVKFLTAKDIPGRNSFYDGNRIPVQDMLFVESKIGASGQAIGLILAETQEVADAAAKKVKVEYEGQEKPLLVIKDGVEKARKDGTFDSLLYPTQFKSAVDPSKNSKHTIKGEFNIGGQAHFHMETHVTLCVKNEDGLTLYTATQSVNRTQETIARVLNVPNNTINIQVRRLGGGYGGKLSLSIQIAAAAAVATHVTKRPVRIVIDLEANLEMMGKRLPYYVEYDAGFNDDGKLDALEATVFCDPGMIDADGTSPGAARFMQSCYAASGWILKTGRVLTNTHRNTYTRAPGTTQGIAIIENIMEHVADALGKDALEIRAANYLKAGDALLPEKPGTTFQGDNLVPSLIEEMKKIGDYDTRKAEVDTFNQNNRWRKRGLAMVPMRYLQGLHNRRFPCFVAIHCQDGTVSVGHGGVEMGQGINTKVAQVTAHEFGIPLSKIVVKPTNNFVSANSDLTGGAITSELVCYATMRACQTLVKRMEPIKKASKTELTWEQLIKLCHAGGIDLRATHQYSKTDPVTPYDIYGVNLTEVEIDVLTGEFKIVRLDLIEDAGKSLSPEVDIGQIEGCVVMGLGLYTEEKLVFHPDTGRLLTRNTWDYKVPLVKDIPEDMRITIMKNAKNPFGVLGSKATGEPPLVMSCTVLFAIKNAIKAARKDGGVTDWFQLDAPVTPEEIAKLCLTNPDTQFVF